MSRLRNRRTRQGRSGQDRRGVLLLVVLVVVALLSIANLSYYEWTFAERQAANAVTRREQASAAADSAVEMLRVYLSQDASTIDQDGGWYENPARFRAMLIADGVQPELRARAAVIAPRWGMQRQEGGRFGLEDESGRLNLNTLIVAETREKDAGRNQLLALPGMTESIANSILDWIDEDEQPRTVGAEASYYSSLDPPYAPSNGPFSTIEQLLLVRDITPELLWGLDQNRNHEASESEAATIALPVDNATGELDGGWASLLTLHSVESNAQADGSPKINVNEDDLEQLHSSIAGVLGEATANFVIAYRQGGPEEEDDEDLTGGNEQPVDAAAAEPPGGAPPVKEASELDIDFEAPAAVAIQDPLDLVGVRVKVVEQGELGVTMVESPWQEGDGSLSNGLTEMMGVLTTSDAESIPGRININQAPRSVLAGLPQMPLTAVDAIVSTRDPAAGSTRADRAQATWLLTEGYLDLEQMRAIAPYVTGKGAAFRAQVLGGYEAGGPVRRQEVVIDTTVSPSRVVMRRDLSPLGAGFAKDVALVPEQAAPR